MTGSGSAKGGAPARFGPAAALCRIAATALLGGLLTATLVRFSPGFGLDERQLDPSLSGQSKEAALRAHDEQRNTLRFYYGYIKRMCAGDLGVSEALGQPIARLIAERTPVTLELMAWGIAGAWALAALLAVPASASRSYLPTAIAAVLSGVPASLPAAGIAILLFRLGAPGKCTVALALFPKVYQYLHGLLRQGYGMPHVLLARAKGLTSWRILFRHVAPPARAQLAALAASSVNMAFGAAVAVEAVCDLPGLGQLAWKSAMARDLPVLVILALVVAVTAQLANLAADICSPVFRSQA